MRRASHAGFLAAAVLAEEGDGDQVLVWLR
jgi:hypothetical protein